MQARVAIAPCDRPVVDFVESLDGADRSGRRFDESVDQGELGLELDGAAASCDQVEGDPVTGEVLVARERLTAGDAERVANLRDAEVLKVSKVLLRIEVSAVRVGHVRIHAQRLQECVG